MSSRTSPSTLETLFATLNQDCEQKDAVQNRGEPAPPPRVLVVEDDAVISYLIEHLLTRAGFGVDLAADGRQAQDLIETLPPPAVVLLDVMLPFVGGFELVECVRRKPEWANVPILMLTSKSQESYVVRAFRAGVDDYVTKPFRPEELVARVRHLAGV
jgi:DNA-binding response OmpR family regulator